MKPPDAVKNETGRKSRTKGVSVTDEIFYCVPTKEYLLKNESGRWLSLNDGGFKRWLRSKGYRSRPAEGESISAAEAVMLHIQDHRDVDFAGAVAGKCLGFHAENGTRFLVTSEAELVEPANGDWRTVQAFIDGLFYGDDSDQSDTQVAVFHGWMRAAYASLCEGKHSHGQALVLCGVAGSGKSCIQDIILSPMLGGRAGKAARFMMGATPFNSDLCGKEHLVLDDEFMSTNMSARLQLGANLKQMCVGTNLVSIHAKNRNAVNLRLWWRVSISVNDDPEAMLVLPPLDDHVADKLILLRCHRFNHPMPMTTPEDKARFAEQVKSELPAYAWWLLNEFRLPDSLQNDRYGVASFHHPELVEALHGLSPQAHMLKLVDQVLFTFGETEWRGTAEEVKRKLLADDGTRREAERLLGWSAAAGTYLSRLAKRPDGRVTQTRTMHSREWIIKAPLIRNEDDPF